MPNNRKMFEPPDPSKVFDVIDNLFEGLNSAITSMDEGFKKIDKGIEDLDKKASDIGGRIGGRMDERILDKETGLNEVEKIDKSLKELEKGIKNRNLLYVKKASELTPCPACKRKIKEGIDIIDAGDGWTHLEDSHKVIRDAGNIYKLMTKRGIKNPTKAQMDELKKEVGG